MQVKNKAVVSCLGPVRVMFSTVYGRFHGISRHQFDFDL